MLLREAKDNPDGKYGALQMNFMKVRYHTFLAFKHLPFRSRDSLVVWSKK